PGGKPPVRLSGPVQSLDHGPHIALHIDRVILPGLPAGNEKRGTLPKALQCGSVEPSGRIRRDRYYSGSETGPHAGVPVEVRPDVSRVPEQQSYARRRAARSGDEGLRQPLKVTETPAEEEQSPLRLGPTGSTGSFSIPTSQGVITTVLYPFFSWHAFSQTAPPFRRS